MLELLDGFPMVLAASATAWLAAGLTVAWFLRRRPAQAHSVLALAAVGALVTPWLVVAVQRANWGVLPAVPASAPRTTGGPLIAFVPVESLGFRPRVPDPRPAQQGRPAKSGFMVAALPPRPMPVATPPLPWRTLIVGAWLVVSGFFGWKLLLNGAAGWWTVRRSLPEPDPALLRIMDEASRRIGVARLAPRLCRSNAVASPALWGWSRPATVLIPLAGTPFENGEAVFCHELAHLKRRDHWTALLAEVLVGVLPWHPLAWLTRRWLSERAEEACDDWTVTSGCPPLDYAEALVNLAPTATPALTVAAVSRRSPLSTRVRRLLAGGLRSPRLGRRWLAGATLGTTVLAAGWALWQPRRASADDPPKPPATVRPAASSVRVVVLDPKGKPLPDAKIHAGYWTEVKGFKRNQDFVTDAQGAARVPLPATYSIVRLWARKPSFVTMWAGWEQNETAIGGRVPAEYTFHLETPVTAGGRIVDEEGKPIAGARVRVSLFNRDGIKPARSDGRMQYNTWLTEKDDAPTTDADGRWRIDNVPAPPDLKLSLLVFHPDYISDESWEDLQGAAGVTTAMLRKGTAEIRLKRGVIVEGRITDPDGKPVTKGLVIHGDDPYFASQRSDYTIKADGHYRLPALPPKETRLTVIAPGWAPQTRRLTLKGGMPAQDFHLERGKPIRLQVVDTAGKPVPRPYVTIKKWQGAEALHNHDHPNVKPTGIPDRGGEDGVWEWTWAPETPVELLVRGDRFAAVPLEIAGGGPTRTVVLKTEHRITGRVTDAKTGRPIPKFAVIPVDIFRKGFEVVERYNSVPGRDGRLDYLADRTDIALRVRIEAEGYRTQDGPEFRVGDDAARTQDFRLRPSPPISGTVVDAAGKPVLRAEVLLATPTQDARLRAPEQGQSTRTDAAGRFAFPDPGEPCAVIARADVGYARADLRSDQHDAGTLRLQAWASVSGRFLDGGKPVGNAYVRIDSIHINELTRPRVDTNVQVTTTPDGRFDFPKVPPGPTDIQAHLGPWDDPGYRSGPSVPLDLQPGQRVELELGGGGAILSGKVRLTGNVPSDLDCTYSINFLVPRAPGIAPPPDVAALGFDARKGWQEAWSQTSEGSAYMSTLPHWFVKLAADGSYRISGVPAGEYDLAVAVYARPNGCLVDPLARRVTGVTVTAADVAAGRKALPDIAAQVVPVPAVGDTPALTFERAGKPAGRLADLRGRYTLVNFWASWCGPCKEQLPSLRALHERFAPRGLSALGLSLDEDPAAWNEGLARLGLPWAQGRLTSAGEAGVSSVPAYWLLDPEGKIVAKANDPEELSAALAERLK